MKIINCKAVSKESKWVYGYPFVKSSGDVMMYCEGDVVVEIFGDSICYNTNEPDRNGKELFIGDIINDFGGGEFVTDLEHPDYHPSQAFPAMKQIGDTTRLGTIILEGGTIRIVTSDLEYAYNISNGSPMNEMEFVSNQHDHLLKP